MEGLSFSLACRVGTEVVHQIGKPFDSVRVMREVQHEIMPSANAPQVGVIIVVDCRWCRSRFAEHRAGPRGQLLSRLFSPPAFGYEVLPIAAVPDHAVMAAGLAFWSGFAAVAAQTQGITLSSERGLLFAFPFFVGLAAHPLGLLVGAMVALLGWLFLECFNRLRVFGRRAWFYTLFPSSVLRVSAVLLGAGRVARLRRYRCFAAEAQALLFAFLASKGWFFWRRWVEGWGRRFLGRGGLGPFTLAFVAG